MKSNCLKPAEYSSLIALLQSRAAHQPHQIAYTFLQDGEIEESHLTYDELDRQAQAIGAFLQSQGAAGERALLLYPPGLAYIAAFFGCLYAGVIAVPVYPPKLTRLDRSLPRLQAIANDARPLVALTTSPILSMLDFFLAQAPDFQTMRWLATDIIDPEIAPTWQKPAVDTNTLAFLQYTSGSTSLPKGVMVSHGNLLHNQAVICQATGLMDQTEGVIGCSWLPMYHDMGLIGAILQSLYVGGPCVLMSPLDFLQKPVRWLQAISRYRATVSAAPNFAYDLCVRKTTPEQRAGLDLGSWRVALNGAEPIRADTLERFATTFEPYGFRREAFFPCYGLAEATLLVSGGPSLAPPVTLFCDKIGLEQKQVVSSTNTQGRAVIGCGQIGPAQRVIIVNPKTKVQCVADQIGEIWISGPSVAQGYWENAAATVSTFQALLADTGDGPFLRTGDLGFIRHGQLYITSRLKDLVIIRGRNHAPQDIELTVEKSHPALRPGCGVAFSVEKMAEERLVVVQEVQRQVRDLDVEAVAGAIRQAVAENHELQVYAVILLKPGGVPKTSSGKLQRHACRADFLADSLEKIMGSSLLTLAEVETVRDEAARLTRSILLAAEPAQRWSVLSNYLRQQLAQALKVPADRLGLEQPFASLGLDSLVAMELKARIEADLEVNIPLVTFMEHPTVAQITDELLVSVTAIPPGFEVAEVAAQLLAQLDSLSDEEVETHLQQLMAEPAQRVAQYS